MQTYLPGLILFVFASLSWAGPPNTDLMVTASGGVLSESNYQGFSPRLGASMSIPLFYEFLKLDVDADLEPIMDFGGSIVSAGHDSINGAIDWTQYYEKNHDRSGIAFTITPRATVYLRRLFFGLGASLKLAYNQGETTQIYYNAETGQELERTKLSGGKVDYSQYDPTFCIGIRHKRFSVQAFQEGTNFVGIKLKLRIAKLPFAIADGDRKYRD